MTERCTSSTAPPHQWQMSPDEAFRNLNVGIARDDRVLEYPSLDSIPFDPTIQFPEYNGPTTSGANPVYSLVRQAVRLLRRDEDGYGTAAWNPLKGIIEPGMHVVIKPNLVTDTVRDGVDLDALFTHTSVLRPVIDFVRAAMNGQGRIILGDAPIARTDWSNLMRVAGLGATVAALNDRSGPPIEVVDFRREVAVRNRIGVVTHREIRDVVDFIEVDLGVESALMPVIHDSQQFRVSRYDASALSVNHNATRNSYMIHRSVMEADVVVNVPKLKAHKKAGISCALKNLVGTVCGKDWLPHFRVGDSQSGSGDQYEAKSQLREWMSALHDSMEVGRPTRRIMAALLCKGLSGVMKACGIDRSCEGNWYGNDTTWRMVHDLNAIICYSRSNGTMSDCPQRRTLHIVDGIVGAERDAPLQPTAHPAGVIVIGTNPLAVDCVSATLMGFDVCKVPLLRDAWDSGLKWELPPQGAALHDICVRLKHGNKADTVDLKELRKRVNLRFVPPDSWVGRIELGE